MPVDINGSPLSFTAVIEDSDFTQGGDKMIAKLRQIGEAGKRNFELAMNAQREYINMLQNSGGAFKNLDESTKKQLATLSALEKGMSELGEVKKQLDAKFKAGDMNQVGYEKNLASLVTRERELATAMIEVSQQLAKSDSLQKAGNSTLAEKAAAVERLETAYRKLSTADQAGDPGKAIQANVAALKSEIAGLDQAFKSINQNAFGALQAEIADINKDTERLKLTFSDFPTVALEIQGLKDLDEKTKEVEKLKVELEALPDAQNIDLLLNIENLEAEITDIRATLTDLPTVAIAGVEESTADLKALENEAQRLKDNLEEVAAMPELSLGNIDQLIDDLEKLQKQYDNLNDSQRADPEIGGKMLLGIRQIETELDKLGVKLKSLPEIKLGSIDERTADIQQLSAAIRALPEVEPKDPKIGGKMIADLQKMEQELDQLNAKIKATPEFKFGSIAGKTAELSRLKQEYSELSGIDRRNATVGVQMKKNIQELEKEVRDLNGEFNKTEGVARKAAVAVGAYFGLQEAGQFIRDVASVRGEFEKLEVTFDTLLKSKTKSSALMQELTELAATTPFELQDIGSAAKQLLAFGIAANDIKPTLLALGDVSAGVGAPIQEIADLYGKARVQGRLFAEDINQLTGRGIPIIGELAKQFGVAEESVKGLVESGQVNFKNLETAFKSLTSSGGAFAGLMEAQSKTVAGQISNLKDAYSQMLNDIGKNNEGFFAGGISAATSLIDNYETVIDVIQVMVATYGAYRAAVALTTAVQMAQATGQVAVTTSSVALGNAQTVLALATGRVRAAMIALQASMLANPFVLATTAVVALGAAYFALREEAIKVKSAQDLLGEANSEVSANFAKQKAEIGSLVKVIQNQNIAESVRVDAYKKLNDIAPDILKGLTLEEAATANLTSSTEKYLAVLKQKITAQAYEGKLVEAVEQQIKAQEQLEKVTARVNNKNGSAKGNSGAGAFGAYAGLAKQQAANANTEVRNAFKLVESAEKTIEDINKRIGGLYGQGTKELIQAEITSLETQQKAFDKLSPQYKKIEDAILKKRKALADLDKGNTAEQVKADKNRAYYEAIIKSNQDGLNALDKSAVDFGKKAALYKAKILQAQKDLEAFEAKGQSAGKIAKQQESEVDRRGKIFDKINALRSEYNRESKTEDEKEIQAIRDKFEVVEKVITDYNKKVKNPKNKIDVEILTNIKTQAIGNKEAEQATEQLKVDIEVQKQLFEQFEQYKLEFGAQKAEERFGNELKGFKNYIEYLNSLLPDESDKSAQANATRDLLGKILPKANKEAREKEFDEAVKNYKRILDATQTAKNKELQINEQYEKDLADLRKNFTGGISDLEGRERKLADNRDKELEEVKHLTFEETQFYKKMFEDITFYSREELQKRIKEIKSKLNDPTLKPVEKRAAESAIQQAEQLLGVQEDSFGQTLDYSKKTAKQAQIIANYAGAASGAFSELAESVRETNPALADTLSTMSELANVAGSAASSVANFAAGNIVGGIQSAIGAITGIIKLINAPRESAKKAREEMEKWRDDQFTGEFEVNRLYRERLRIQQDINEETLSGLREQSRLLEGQLSQNKTEFAKILAELYKQQYVAGQKTEKYGGFLGIKKKTRTVDVMQSLSGKTYEELERLSMLGLLDDRAKELFAALQKLKEEGADINELIREAQQQVQQLLTGTTADKLVDDFANLFDAGRPAAADLADFFEKQMRNAALSIFQSEYLNQAMQAFYKDFAKAAENGVTEEEKKALSDAYKSMAQDALDVYDDLMKVTGTATTNPSTANKNNMAGAIQGITAEQAALLAGQFGGLRITNIEQLEELRLIRAILAGGTISVPAAGNNSFSVPGMLEVASNTAQTATHTQQIVINGREQVQLMMRQLDYARETAVNTGESALHLRRLQSMETSLKNMERKITANADIARANGIGG